MRLRAFSTSFKGKIDKIVVVIKDREQIALERYLFSVETMIDIEGFNKDTGYACL
jgi:mitotic spindle assembly checkpoint protein MAD2B